MSPRDTNHNSEQNHRLPSPPHCVLFLNGFPGVGKLTLAKALEYKLKLSGTPYILIDNHKLIDPVVAIEPKRNTAHYTLRKVFRKTIFDLLVAVKEDRLVIIFTACLATSKIETLYDDIEQFKEYVEMADQRGAPLAVVNVVCDLKANIKRLQSEDRVEMVDGKTKLADSRILEKIRGQNTLLKKEEALRCGNSGKVLHFELDTTGLKVEEAAQKILEFLHTSSC